MFLFSRSRKLLSNFRSGSFKDIMQPIVAKKSLEFDHVAIDVGHASAGAVRMTDDLLGEARNEEMCRYVSKHIFQVLLKRVTPRKSLALFFDGSDPLWKLKRQRKATSKKFESRFMRSCSSQTMFLMEDALRNSAMGKNFPEVVISGPAIPGPVESKLSSWCLDLAAREGGTASSSDGSSSNSITSADSFCFLGGSNLLLSSLALTPFVNMSTMQLDQRELKEGTLSGMLEFFSIPPEIQQDNEKIAKIRTDLTFLLLLTQGCSAMDLGKALDLTMSNVIEGYHQNVISGKHANSDKLLFTEQGVNLSLDTALLTNILQRCATRINTDAKSDVRSSDFLEIALQSHAMLCGGAIPNHGFIPQKDFDGDVKILLNTFLSHLRSVEGGAVKASVDRMYALTPAEQLLVGAPSIEHAERNVTSFSNDGTLVASCSPIVQQPDVNEAVKMARQALSVVRAEHVAMTHTPSHCWVKKPGANGPPENYEYFSVNIGKRSRDRETRCAKNHSAGGSGGPTIADARLKNAVYEFVPGEKDATTGAAAWEPKITPVKGIHTTGTSTAATDDDHHDDAKKSNDGIKTLKLVTWNVQFSRHSGKQTPLGRPGINWCTETRYVALSKELASTDADIIAMQETEKSWYLYLSKQDWVKQNYRMSCAMDGDAISPWGILVLIHKRLPVNSLNTYNIPGYSGHAAPMPTITVPISSGLFLSIAAIHLLAPYSDNHIKNREDQVKQLTSKLQKNVGLEAVCMGDFNDSPDKFFRFPEAMRFQDCWNVLHPNASNEVEANEGYTINGHRSEYTAKIIEPEFFGRSDRILYSGKLLKPKEMHLLGTKKVQEVLNITTCPSYLYPSDHFGICCSFDVNSN